MGELEILYGSITAVVFQNYENGYAILRMEASDGQEITVVGTIPMPAVGEWLEVTGKWGSHAAYGRQFEAEFLNRMMPRSSKEILGYLSGGAIKGIGKELAKRIVHKFGDRTLEVMEQEPQRLAEIKGISERKAEEIGEEFRLKAGMRQLLEFFTANGFPAELAVKTYKLYGDGAMDFIYEDPYLLMDERIGAGFEKVDAFAVENGVQADDHRRVEAGILYELGFNLQEGHTFLPEEKLIAATAQLLNLDADVIPEGIARLQEAERLFRQKIRNVNAVYLPELYEAELFCSERLLGLQRYRHRPIMEAEKYLSIAEKESGLQFSEQQKQAIRAAGEEGVLLITGGPGTGKTTILRGILSLYDQVGIRYVLAAPTGRAAKRLTEVTGQEASTIHRLLEAGIDPQTGKTFFARNENSPLIANAIIVDEMSMVDVRLLHNLLKAIPTGKRIIMVGDPDQLPPVGPGSPLRDILKSGVLTTVCLTEIFRQAQQSRIVMNAYSVNSGVMPDLQNRRDGDFFFMPRNTDEEIAQTICALCSERLPKNMGIPADQIQVLTPTRKGGIGTGNLNVLLQQVLNPASPGKTEHKRGNTTFRVGDRVMQIRNNYDIVWHDRENTKVGAGVFNGDVGTVEAINRDVETVTVAFDDRIVEYDYAQLGELELAYAMTVHKSQGSEYRAVILAAGNASPYLLYRKVLYTAITRAREIFIIVGQSAIVETMTTADHHSRRYTGLKLRLQENL